MSASMQTKSASQIADLLEHGGAALNDVPDMVRRAIALLREQERQNAVLLLVLQAIFAGLDKDKPDAPGHCHAVPGKWDKDGSDCEWCTTWNAARALLGGYSPTDANAGDVRDLIDLCRNQIEAAKNHQTMMAWEEPETPRRILAALLQHTPAATPHSQVKAEKGGA